MHIEYYIPGNASRETIKFDETGPEISAKFKNSNKRMDTMLQFKAVTKQDGGKLRKYYQN